MTRPTAADFPPGARVLFFQRGYQIGTSLGDDLGSQLRVVVRDDDGSTWIVEAHKLSLVVTPARLHLAQLARAARGHVEDVVSMGRVSATSLAAQSDDEALDGWDRLGILGSCGLDRDATDEGYREARIMLAREIRAAASHVALGITVCPGCGTPTHASESDDTGRCASCRPVEEEVFHCAWCGAGTRHEDGYSPDEANGDLICEECHDGAEVQP